MLFAVFLSSAIGQGNQTWSVALLMEQRILSVAPFTIMMVMVSEIAPFCQMFRMESSDKSGQVINKLAGVENVGQ